MIEIRTTQQSDYEKAGRMVQETLRLSFKDLYSQELIEAFCKKYELENFIKKAEQIDYFVAEDSINKEIVGIIGLKDNEVRTFFVHPHYQGQSIGTKLYNRLEHEAKRRGIAKLILEGSPLGRPVYEHFGFTKIKTITKEREGIEFEDSVMEKELD